MEAIDIKKAEKAKNATYMGDFSVKTKNGWSRQSIAIFYQENPAEGHTHYFGLYKDNLTGQLMITAGDSAFSEPITGIASSDGEVVYSRSGHDFRSLSNGEGCIDGGREYFRILGSTDGYFPATVQIEAQGPNLVVTKVTSEKRSAYPHQPTVSAAPAF